jgi:precorrin-6Y C5,15-methyltransferase (decarboxylating)
MKPWLYIIGIGEEGYYGLPDSAREIINAAELIVSGGREFDVLGPVNAEKLLWENPISITIEKVSKWKGRRVVLLASGDPFFYGSGSLFLRKFSPEEIYCMPGSSACSLAASKLKWNQQDCTLMSLHGRALENIIRHLQPNAKIISLSWDNTTPSTVAKYLTEHNMGDSIIYVLEHMGGDKESIRSCIAKEFNIQNISYSFNTLAVEVKTDKNSRIIPYASGIPDYYYENCKLSREIRALTVSALSPYKGQLLWEIGSDGSVAIEWMLADTFNLAIAMQEDEQLSDSMRTNAVNMGVPELCVINREPMKAFDILRMDEKRPDCVYIEEIVTEEILEYAYEIMNETGKLVINAFSPNKQKLVSEISKKYNAEILYFQYAKNSDLPVSVMQTCIFKQ